MSEYADKPSGSQQEIEAQAAAIPDSYKVTIERTRTEAVVQQDYKVIGENNNFGYLYSWVTKETTQHVFTQMVEADHIDILRIIRAVNGDTV